MKTVQRSGAAYCTLWAEGDIICRITGKVNDCCCYIVYKVLRTEHVKTTHQTLTQVCFSSRLCWLPSEISQWCSITTLMHCSVWISTCCREGSPLCDFCVKRAKECWSSQGSTVLEELLSGWIKIWKGSRFIHFRTLIAFMSRQKWVFCSHVIFQSYTYRQALHSANKLEFRPHFLPLIPYRLLQLVASIQYSPVSDPGTGCCCPRHSCWGMRYPLWHGGEF